MATPTRIRPARNHAEIVFDGCHVRRSPDRRAGEDSPGAATARWRRIHHSMRWLGQATVVDIMCEGRLPHSHASCWPAPDDPGLHRAVAHGDPGRAAADLPDRLRMDKYGPPRSAELGMIKAHVSRSCSRCSTARSRSAGAGYSAPARRGWYGRPDSAHRRRPESCTSRPGAHAAAAVRAGRGLASEHIPAGAGCGEALGDAAHRRAWREHVARC